MRVLHLFLLAAMGSSIGAAAEQGLADGPCAPQTVIESIELGAEGLWITSAAPVAIAIADAQAVTDPAGASFGLVTVEIDGALLAAMPPVLEAAEGPFSSMRISRFRHPGGCGIRIRLQARELAPWVVDRVDPNRVRIGPRPGPPVAASPLPATRGPRGGAFELIGDVGLSGGSERDPRGSYRLTVGFSQALGGGATLLGFFGGLDEPAIEGSPFGALAAANIDLKHALATFAAGDLLIGLGGRSRETRFFNGLLLRGGAAMVRRGATTFEIFGGRAARSELLRIRGGGGVISALGDDTVYGAQATWDATESSSFGGGWVASAFGTGRRRHNFFQSADLDFRSWDLRALLEESHADDDRGYALTVDPAVRTRRLSLSGFYRYRSAEFEPSLASGYFANLRRSYALASSWRASDRLSLSASAGQLKSFSLLDPLDAGTLTTTRAAGARYQAMPRLSLFGNYQETTRESDPGVVLRADSHSSVASIGSSLGFDDSSATFRLARQHVVSAVGTFASDIVEVDLNRRISSESQVYGRATYGESRQAEGKRELGLAVGGMTGAGRLGRVRGDLRFIDVPAGVYFDSVRHLALQIGVDGGVVERLIGGSLNVHYSIAETREVRQSAWGLFISFGQILDWGAESRPNAPFARRALPVEVPEPRRTSEVRVLAFLDADGDGMRGQSERGLAGLSFFVDGNRVTTDERGEASITVRREDVAIVLERNAASVDLYTPEERIAIETVAARSHVAVPFRPAGRVAGSVVLIGEATSFEWLSSIAVTIRGEGIARETVTGADGGFNFGSLPAGRYTVEIVQATLASESRLEGPPSVEIDVRAGERSIVEFALRRATARERFGISAPRPRSSPPS